MKIVTLYRTSKGIFKTWEQAEKNRVTETDRWGPVGKEPIVPIHALRYDSPKGPVFFELKSLVVK